MLYLINFDAYHFDVVGHFFIQFSLLYVIIGFIFIHITARYIYVYMLLRAVPEIKLRGVGLVL